MKGQKGITLVALVITIIVMLILVGVSLSLVLDADFIGKAKNGVEETNAAAIGESTGTSFSYTDGANNTSGYGNIIDAAVNGF